MAHSQERLLLLEKVKTHGEKFMVIVGGHLTSDNFFKAMDVNAQKKDITAMAKEK